MFIKAKMSLCKCAHKIYENKSVKTISFYLLDNTKIVPPQCTTSKERKNKMKRKI